MTIRHSSSRRGALTTSAVLFDSISRPIRLGAEIGRGGEGSVFEVDAQPALVAKVYHKRPLLDSQVAKLQAMASTWSTALESISSWPRSVLYDPVAKKPCGILMARMTDARPLHELYGTANRRKHFPECGWHHLVLAARNTAAAFQTLHDAGIVVGDVNQGNLLVDPKMCVRMIDCDSFQITNGATVYNCPVGTPHFTPPELQTLKLRDVVRTVNHDRFGLAVLIFHLIFVGRHPFAGRYRGPSDLPIEKAIGERRFAFSKNSAETLMEPPPHSLVLDDLPPEIGQLFEQAFRGPEGADRPGAVEWVRGMESLMQRRRTCTFDPMHVYYSGLNDCPWCRIEDSGGPSFFVNTGGSPTVSADRLAALEERVFDLPEITFPELSPSSVALPKLPRAEKSQVATRKTWLDFLAPLVVLACLGTIAAAFFSGIATGVAAGASVLLAGILLFSKQGRLRRRMEKEKFAELSRYYGTLTRMANTITEQHQQRAAAFAKSVAEYQREMERFRADEEQIRDVLAEYREMQKADYLRGYLIRDYRRSIPGITNSQIAIMESYGVESANELDRMQLYGIPSVDSELVMELLQWRTQIERGFVFRSEHGVQMKDLEVSKEVAVRKLKISQARKILTASAQLEKQAAAGKDDLTHALKPYDKAVAEWLSLAREYQVFQRSRNVVERWLNRRSIVTICGTLAVAAAAGVVHLLMRQ
jgi:DNA-binding helix-hairpin-helix protein with protein kinase domain